MPRKKKCLLKRLSMYIPADIHAELERTAEKRNDTITKLVLEAIIYRMAWEKKHE